MGLSWDSCVEEVGSQCRERQKQAIKKYFRGQSEYWWLMSKEQKEKSVA